MAGKHTRKQAQVQNSNGAEVCNNEHIPSKKALIIFTDPITTLAIKFQHEFQRDKPHTNHSTQCFQNKMQLLPNEVNFIALSPAIVPSGAFLLLP
jgi:hypothetical protein